MSTPRYTQTFPDYPEADAWITRLSGGGPWESIINTDIAGETTVTLEGDFARRALDKERPLAPGGFHLAEIDFTLPNRPCRYLNLEEDV